jgi:hypothetical protein
MIGEGQKPKDHVSDRATVDFNTAGSFALWSNTDVGDGRPSTDAASSIYSHRTSSACAQPVLKVKHTPWPARTISWLDGIVNNPYGYTTDVADQPLGLEANQTQQTLTTTAFLKTQARNNGLPPPPGND